MNTETIEQNNDIENIKNKIQNKKSRVSLYFYFYFFDY